MLDPHELKLYRFIRGIACQACILLVCCSVCDAFSRCSAPHSHRGAGMSCDVSVTLVSIAAVWDQWTRLLSYTNVRGEPEFSVMASRLVLWKVRLNWGSGGCETGAFEKQPDFNRQPVWGGGFLLGWIVKHADFITFNLSRIGYHLVLGFRLSISPL